MLVLPFVPEDGMSNYNAGFAVCSSNYNAGFADLFLKTGAYE